MIQIINDSIDSEKLTLEGTAVLRILVDSNMRKTWADYMNDINANKFKLDPDILNDYNDILEYKNKMQLTNDSTLTNLKKLGWADGEAFNKWIDMNEALRKKIKSYTNLE